MLVTLLSFVACSTSEPPAEPPSPAVEPEAPEPAANRARLPPPRPDGLEPVSIVGHGLRVRVYPPFQVVSMQDVMGRREGTNGSDDLLISWWDVSLPDVGKGGGRGGLFNSRVVAAPVPEGASEIRELRDPRPKGGTTLRYRLGETGSYVQLPPVLSGAGGMLSVEPGPPDPRWGVQSNGEVTPLEPRKFLQSADPAVGPGFEFTAMPHQPWGPWPTPQPESTAEPP